MTRRSVWSKDSVQELLRKFVPATDEVGRLQRGKDPVARAFQEFAEQGHYKGRVKPSSTRQGIYAVTPGGRFLASCNTRSAKRVERMLEQALQRWGGLSEVERLAGSEAFVAAPASHWAKRFPVDGLVLRISTRDLPGRKQPKDWRAAAWNLDYAWFRAAEVHQFVPDEPVKGKSHKLPAALVTRLVRLHMRDNVRGQVNSFRKKEVERADLRTEVVSVNDARVKLQLVGSTRAVRRGQWHVAGFKDSARQQEQGFETELLGYATFDRKSGRFTSFEMVAVGRSWGGSRFNARADDLAGGPIGVSFTLSNAEESGRVPPARVWEYRW